MSSIPRKRGEEPKLKEGQCQRKGNIRRGGTNKRKVERIDVVGQGDRGNWRMSSQLVRISSLFSFFSKEKLKKAMKNTFFYKIS